MARYEARIGDPYHVWDYRLGRVSSEHLSFGSAVSRAYCLNAFSTGIHADVIPFPANTEVGQ